MTAVLEPARANKGWGGLRLKATGIHLAISLAVAAVAAALVFGVWYPRGYAALMRGGELFFILMACDVILGPALSFVICNPAKSRRALVLDYAVIGAVQLAALVYGLSVVAQSRPAFEVFSIDRFNVVSAFEVENDGSANVPRFVPGWWGPKPITLVLPTDSQARNKALDLELSATTSRRSRWTSLKRCPCCCISFHKPPMPSTTPCAAQAAPLSNCVGCRLPRGSAFSPR
jgi:hypothetical protein